MVELDLSVFYVLVGVLLLTASKVTSLKSQESGNNLIKHLDTVSGQLQGLSRSIRSAHSDLTQQQIEECQIMGPMSDPICALLDLDQSMTRTENLDALVHNKFSPGKRADDGMEAMSRRKALLQDLLRKRKFLEDLKDLVDRAQSSIQVERRRSCNLNLGFHCQTEQYSAIADMYNWLQSPLSPGRRKRDTRARRSVHTNNKRLFLDSPTDMQNL